MEVNRMEWLLVHLACNQRQGLVSGQGSMGVKGGMILLAERVITRVLGLGHRVRVVLQSSMDKGQGQQLGGRGGMGGGKFRRRSNSSSGKTPLDGQIMRKWMIGSDEFVFLKGWLEPQLNMQVLVWRTRALAFFCKIRTKYCSAVSTQRERSKIASRSYIM